MIHQPTQSRSLRRTALLAMFSVIFMQLTVTAAEPAAGDSPAAPAEQVHAEQAKARARMRADARTYKPEQIREAEQLYQVANKKWRSPEGIDSLKQMIAKYPKMNRTGCALLYLGQMTEGQQGEDYLRQAIKDFGDCFYGDGVQVGAFARYVLAMKLKDTGKADEANQLLHEILAKYPNAVDHHGDRMSALVKEELPDANSTKPAT